MNVALIDEEITQQRVILRNLCSRRNSLTFISRLPTELLESIFIQLAYDAFNCVYGAPRVRDWIRFSHVSSHWRNVALNCPILWSYIQSTSKDWIDIFLARSAQVPLKICVDVDNRVDACKLLNFTKKILEHVERIEELRFYTRSWNISTSQCFATFYSSASRLRVLNFSMRHPRSSQGFGGIPPPCHFFMLGGVTTLSLEFAYPSLQLDVPGFQAVIHSMPDLVNLYLDGALASASDFISSAEFDPAKKMDLPRLSRLLVVAPLSAIIALLSSVNIPVHTQMRLDSSNSGERPLHDNYSQLGSLLAQHYHDDRISSLPIIHSAVMRLDHFLGEEISFIFSTSPKYDRVHLEYALSTYHWCPTILLEISTGPRVFLLQDASILGREICAAVPTINVHALHISGPPSCPAFWKDILGHFPGLRRLKFSAGKMHQDLVSVFLPKNVTDEFVENQSGRVRAPVLEELLLNYMAFQRDADPSDSRRLKTLRSLCSALSTRTGPRGRLVMTKCYLDANVCCDMVGQWEDGSFRVVSMCDKSGSP